MVRIASGVMPNVGAIVIKRPIREVEMEDWDQWTPCEMYGHEFDEDGRCECGERRDA
jgi:hypothetical protein